MGQVANLPRYSAFLEFFSKGTQGGPCECSRPLAERSLKYPSYTNFTDRRWGAGLLIQTNRNPMDVEDPLASPLALALRVCLADEGEVFERDRTVKAWVAPIRAEAAVTRALRDCALSVVGELSSDTGPVVEYQREQLSRLAARLA